MAEVVASMVAAEAAGSMAAATAAIMQQAPTVVTVATPAAAIVAVPTVAIAATDAPCPAAPATEVPADIRRHAVPPQAAPGPLIEPALAAARAPSLTASGILSELPTLPSDLHQLEPLLPHPSTAPGLPGGTAFTEAALIGVILDGAGADAGDAVGASASVGVGAGAWAGVGVPSGRGPRTGITRGGPTTIPHPRTSIPIPIERTRD